MKLSQVAIQFYTLRERLKSRKDIESTVKRVADIGYPAIQISGMSWDLISEPDMAALCRAHGLTICATHEPGVRILNEPEKVVERLKALDCTYTAYPYPAGIDFGDIGQVDELILKLDHAGKVLADAGRVLTYHNHHMEFRKLEGATILDRIYDRTNPAWVQGEPDTYWVQYGGGDPAAWCRKLKGRLPLIHLKDFMITEKNEIAFAEVGSGNLDFPSIIKAAEESGCRWFIVEQDTCPGDEFESIEKSFAYIRSHLLSPS